MCRVLTRATIDHFLWRLTSGQVCNHAYKVAPVIILALFFYDALPRNGLHSVHPPPHQSCHFWRCPRRRPLLHKQQPPRLIYTQALHGLRRQNVLLLRIERDVSAETVPQRRVSVRVRSVGGPPVLVWRRSVLSGRRQRLPDVESGGAAV